MSSSGIQAVSSGPLIIRTYNDSSSSDVTYVLKDYDYPVSSNYVLITSTNGKLVPSDDIYVSSITTSSFQSDFIRASTAYLSSVFGFSPVQFYSPVRINNTNPPTDGPQLFVNGSTVFSEPGAQSTAQIAGVNIWGLPNGNTINTNFTTTSTFTINEPVSKINFQLIGAGGANTFSNTNISTEDLPGIGTYISGTLKVKQGDKLQFTIGALGGLSNGSQGTSLVYLSSTTSPTTFVSTLVCVAGAGGGNGWSPDLISTSSGGGHGGGGSGGITVSGNVDYYAFGTTGFSGISTVNGNYQSIVEGGQGGQASGGAGGIVDAPATGVVGIAGSTSNITTLLTTGGLVLGGAGGNGGKTGGYGGGGYTGGGGGAGSINTSAGGGGGSTYIALSTLSSILTSVVCLGGQWISQNNATPFGGDYGLPNNPGYASLTGYQPNDTLYTNGDIECRVLRYTMLDPPINSVGGVSALWSLYPAIDIVHMNDNPIVECGGLEVESGGIDVTGNSIFRNKLTITSGGANITDEVLVNVPNSDTHSGITTSSIQSGANSKLSMGFYQMTPGDNTTIHPSLQSYRASDLLAEQIHINPSGGNVIIGQNFNPVVTTINGGTINIGTVAANTSTIINGKVGIGTTNPSTSLQVVVPPGGNGITGISAKSDDVNTTIGAYSQGWFLDDNVGSVQVTREDNSTFYTLALNPRGGDVYLGSTINNFLVFSASTGIGTTSPTTQLQVVGTTSTNSLSVSSILTNATSLNISATNTSTIGNLNVSNNLNIGDNLNVSDVTTLNGLIVSSITTNAASLNITATNTSTIGNLNINGNQTISGNQLVTGNVTCNTLNYTSLSPNVVTKLKTTGPNISISGGSGPDINGFYTGNLSLDVTENPTINVVAYNPSEPKTDYFGKNVVINTPVASISLTGTSAVDGNFITFINNTNGVIDLLANSLSVRIFQNTIQTAIYFSTWILPQYYSPPPLYVLINNVDANTTLYYASLRDYTKLDYILVGGGGGGGGAVYQSTETANYGGGGGGSGYLSSSFTYIAVAGQFSYNITTITNVNGTLTIPQATTLITINIGDGGPGGASVTNSTGGTGTTGDPTQILFDGVLQASAAGGLGGLGGTDSGNCGGAGGNGWNGGGGGGGGSCGGGAGTGTGGASGGAGSGGASGGGGGSGAGLGRSIQSSNGSNAGGGGGAGTLVTIANTRTGGDGGNSKRFGDNDESSQGVDYTGGGGGGSSTDTGSSGGPPARVGGKGYAILYFHN